LRLSATFGKGGTRPTTDKPWLFCPSPGRQFDQFVRDPFGFP
jgi:hypothetical protein